MKRIVSLVSLVILTACGGGGAIDPNATPTPQPVQGLVETTIKNTCYNNSNSAITVSNDSDNLYLVCRNNQYELISIIKIPKSSLK